MRSAFSLSALLLVLLVVQTLANASAWSNGGYSSDPSSPDYGTHDWVAEHAKNLLPAVERKWIDDNLNLFLYGTEYPDNSGASYGKTYGYGDKTKHHNYYSSDGSVTDPSAGIRASEEYQKALSELRAGRNDTAAVYAGSLTHYIADLSVFSHVLTVKIHHDDYEDYVKVRTSSYDYGVFESYLVFDGKLENTSAYDASISLGWKTLNDNGGAYTASWMDTHYDWSNAAFRNRCGDSLGLAVNYVADVLHTLAVAAFGTAATTRLPSQISCSATPAQIIEGGLVTVTGSIYPPVTATNVTLTYKRPDGSTLNRTRRTDSDGVHIDSYQPDATGSWTVTASWRGDLTYEGAVSPPANFTVIAPTQWNPLLLALAALVIMALLILVIAKIRR